MSKKGRGRRSPERRIADQDRRSTVGYVQNVRRKVQKEQWDKMLAAVVAADAEQKVSETTPAVTP